MMQISTASEYFSGALPLAAGSVSMGLVPDQMVGLWSFRLGRFGCRDAETRGGVTYFVEDGRVAGGDSHYSFLGRWKLNGSELEMSLHIQRLAESTERDELAGFAEQSFELTVTAEALASDYFEGLARRSGYADFRTVIRRLG